MKAPMTLPPVIGEPFRRMAMDIVGPLPKTGRGNRFVLVISDYAIRYPEAVPLRNISAGKIAEVLIDIFARHGIPEEILTDQGTNLTSALLGELYRLIGIKALQTSPYHPQADGLVERFNQTLKVMLKKVLKGRKEIGIARYPRYCLLTVKFLKPPWVSALLNYYTDVTPEDFWMCCERNGSTSLKQTLTLSAM